MVKHSYSARVCAPSALRPEEITAWQQLCATGPTLASPFYTVHYARAVEAAGVRVNVCVIYRDQLPCAFLPFQFATARDRMLGVAEPVGGGMTDYFGLVAAAEVRIQPAQLLQLARLNYLGFSHLDESQLALGLTGTEPRIGLRSDIVPSAPVFMSEIALRQKKYLNDATRLGRKLQEDVGPIHVELDRTVDRAAAMQQLIEEKRAQYQRTGAPDALAETWKLRLLHRLSELRQDGCRGVLSTLHAGDQWMASHFGLMGNGVLQYWFPVYNPAFSKYAPGRLLNLALIKDCATLGFSIFDRGEGESDDKRKLANAEHLYYRGAWHNRSLASFSHRCLQSLSWRWQARRATSTDAAASNDR